LWRKRRYFCEGCQWTFTETHPALPPRQRVSARFRGWLFERVREGAARAEVAREEHTIRYQVQTAFQAAGDELMARRARGPPRRLSLDEAHHRRGRELATVVSDLDRRRVIEVLDGTQRRVVERFVLALPEHVRAGIEGVSIDPSVLYRQAIRAALPDARSVCDWFHLVRGANVALDTVRRERPRDASTRRRARTRRSSDPASWRPEL
jgi:transposase